MTKPKPQDPDAMTTRRVSVTPPATLLGGWVPQTIRRVSVTQPGPQGPDAVTIRRISVTPTATLHCELGAANDLVRPCDVAMVSGPVCLDNLGSLSDLIYGLWVRITKSGSVIVAASRWLNNL